MHVYGNGIPQPKFHFKFIVDADIAGSRENGNSLKINYRGLTLHVMKTLLIDIRTYPFRTQPQSRNHRTLQINE